MPTQKFAELLQAIDEAVDRVADTPMRTRTVRDLLRTALCDGDFRVDCVDRLLDTLGPGRCGPHFPTLHRDPVRGYSVRMFFWPPGLVNTPHRHDHWTVTGVLHNTLQFSVFALDGRGQLVMPATMRIDAVAGEVGYICTPCVHNVANHGAAASISLHVFSHPRRADEPNDLVEYPLKGTVAQPSAHADAESPRDHALGDCAQMLGSIGGPQARAALDRIIELGSQRAKLQAVKALGAVDPAHAAAQASRIAGALPAALAARLQRASAAILARA